MPEKFTASREELPGLYSEVLEQNPLLARLDGILTSLNWSREEILIMQLLTACKSNASMQERLRAIDRSRLLVPGH